MMHAGNPIVTVIIPTYNRADLVSDAIDSVLSQSYHDLELIVVDDGSTDNTKEVVSAYGDNVKYFHKENGGNAVARNYGIGKSTGKYIAFLDHDDIWHPKRLERLIGFLEDNNEYGAVISEIEFVDMGCKTISASDYRKDFPGDGAALVYVLKNFVALFSNLVMRRNVALEVGEIDEDLKAASDIDYYLRIAVHYKIGLYPEPLLKYRKTGASFSNKVFTKNRLKVIEKFKRRYPELTQKYKGIIDGALSGVHLSYAEDLLWNRYIKEAQMQILESIAIRPTPRSLVLYIKSIIMQVLSGINPGYRDKGVFNG